MWRTSRPARFSVMPPSGRALMLLLTALPAFACAPDAGGSLFSYLQPGEEVVVVSGQRVSEFDVSSRDTRIDFVVRLVANDHGHASVGDAIHLPYRSADAGPLSSRGEFQGRYLDDGTLDDSRSGELLFVYAYRWGSFTQTGVRATIGHSLSGTTADPEAICFDVGVGCFAGTPEQAAVSPFETPPFPCGRREIENALAPRAWWE